MNGARSRRCALLTGATGFVGSRLARRLAREGWEVHAIVRPQSNLKELSPVLPDVRVATFQGLSRQLNEIVAEAAPDIVFHLASKFVAEHESDQVGELIDSNVRFGTQLLEAMTANGVGLLVNVGTSWQHFDTVGYRPVCLYAATKQAFDAVLGFYVDAYPLHAVTLKLYDTYGPGDPRAKLLSALRSSARSDAPVAFSAGKQMIDLVYIDDVIDAFVATGNLLLEGRSERKQEYAVSSGCPVSLRAIAETYSSVLGAPLNILWGSRPYRKREVMVPWNSGKPVPGWSPKVSLREGILRTEGLGAFAGHHE
jgi:nucleoside-diphosphate-sugar epimerase